MFINIHIYFNMNILIKLFQRKCIVSIHARYIVEVRLHPT